MIPLRSGMTRTDKVNNRLTFRYAGGDSYLWPSSALEPSSSASAYQFYITGNNIKTSHGPYARYFAFPLRCLITTAVGKDEQLEDT